MSVVFKSIYKLFVLILLVTYVGNLSAQLYCFNKISTPEGDVNLSVRQVLQDKQGRIWLATFSGLYLFEGEDYIFKHKFSNLNRINPDVTALLEDRQGNIWIGTNNGLCRYAPETELLEVFRNSDNPNSLTTNKIRSLAMDHYGRIWVGTYDKGLFVYDYESENEGFTKISFENQIPNIPEYIKTIYPKGKDEIWFGTLKNGLYCFNYQNSQVHDVVNFREEDNKRKISHNYVFEIFEDANGTMVVGTRNGLNIYNKEQKNFDDISSDVLRSGSSENYFRSIISDRNNKIWIGTWGGLIVCDSFSDFSSGNYNIIKHHRNTSNSISHNQIMDIYQDLSGVIWIATENGLNKYDPYFNQFQPLTGEGIDDLSVQTATDFGVYKGNVMMLTLSDGLLIEHDDGFHEFCNKSSVFKNEKFYSFYVDSENNVWAGSSNGLLLKIDAETRSVSSYMHSSENIPIHSIVELNSNLLAIGTYGEGLKYFNTKACKFRKDRGVSAKIQINDVFVDSKMQLWIASQYGIFKKGYNNDLYEYYLPDNTDSILNPNIYFNIVESQNGEIFVGGRNGLYKYVDSTNTFTNCKFDNRTKIWVTNLQFDSKQNLWLNLNFNKIAQYRIRDNQFHVYNVNNGIRSNSQNQRGFYVDENDRVLISGVDEIIEFELNNVINNKYSPKPFFTSLQINNTDINPGVKLNNQQILNKNIAFQDKIVLNHLNKDFTISFTSASYLNSKENQYRYILHGYDEEWQWGKGHKANYVNLSSGDYVFEVYSSNNDGIWSLESATIDIKILPAPLLSKWAFFIYILLLIVVAYFVRRFILTRIKLRHELLIEKVKRDKEEKFNKERLQFYTNISHELRTPLTLIMSPIKELLDTDKSKSEAKRLHQLVLNNSQRLLSLVNQLLDFRKAIHQTMKLKVTNINIVEVVGANIEAFAYMANEKNIEVDFIKSSNEIYGWLDREKIDIVLFNILSNAFKYTPAMGSVTIELKQPVSTDKDSAIRQVELSVKNSGKGIPRHLQDKVFNRFYQIKNSSSTGAVNTGSGIGLSLVKELVDLHHGKITLNSDPGRSTTFSVLLPVDKEFYSDEEIFDFKRDADRRTRELIKTVQPDDNDSVFEKKDINKQSVLVVEDNTELRNYLVGFLSKIYTVFSASDGLEGVQSCMDNNPDLIVSDVMMENMDGFSFCKKIKSTPEVSHIPVILMTALTNVENKLEGYKTGADDYITKPFEPELLKLRMQNILESRKKIREGFRHNANISVKEITVSKIDEEFLNNVIDMVEANIDNASFDIDCFSKNIGVSSSQLYRKIKGITGISPNEFIRNYRLRKAAKMILETNLSISEIAYGVGFNDSRYFSKCFKKQFGVVPTQYSSNS